MGLFELRRRGVPNEEVEITGYSLSLHLRS